MLVCIGGKSTELHRGFEIINTRLILAVKMRIQGTNIAGFAGVVARCRLCIFFVATMLVVLAVPSQAQTLKIATIGVSPFGIIEPNGAESGLFYEIANKIAEEAGLPHENKVLPYRRVMLMIESGDADMTIAFLNDGLKKNAVQIAPVIRVQNIAIGRAGTEINSITDLRGKNVTSIRDANYDDRVTNDPQIFKTATDNIEQNLSMLLAGRVDATIGVKDSLFYELRKMGHRTNELGKPYVLVERDLVLHLSRRHADDATIKALTAALKRLKEKKVIQKITEKYFPGFE
jgi:polar amino acid transport system substrate-binding protein